MLRMDLRMLDLVIVLQLLLVLLVQLLLHLLLLMVKLLVLLLLLLLLQLKHVGLHHHLHDRGAWVEAWDSVRPERRRKGDARHNIRKRGLRCLWRL